MARTAASTPGDEAYERKKAAERERQRLIALDGRDIGKIPEIADRERRELCKLDLIRFCQTYLPAFFPLVWSNDQRMVAGMIQRAVLQGGRFAMAMPRGSGKTTLTISSVIWALLYGHQRFVGVFGPTDDHAEKVLLIIRRNLENNESLYQDFPEVCYPIRALGGIANKCAGQLHQGERTLISWGKTELTLPTIPESVSSAAVVVAKGIDSGLRGMLRDGPEGSLIRPSFVVFDDPQTDSVARSHSQTQTLVNTFNGAVGGLAAPGHSLAIVIPCTVIRRGDFSDQCLDRAKNPELQGVRLKLVNKWPTAVNLWSEYCTIRAESYAKGGDGSEATEFYARHRHEMDAGAEVSWPERFEPGDLSALQYAHNLRARNETAFWAEYQNDPLDNSASVQSLTATEITSRTNGIPRAHIPSWASHVVGFVDVQQKLLYWLVAAFDDQFRGAVVDYGAWPDQRQHYYTLAGATRTIMTECEGMSEEAAITKALTAITGQLAGKEWPRDGGGSHRLERLAIDANWGPFAEVVYSFVRSSPHSAILLPSHGRYFGATSRLMAETKKQPGERTGLNWRITSGEKRGSRPLQFDTNWWKSFAAARLSAPVGDRSALTLFGDRSVEHALLADHFLAEDQIPVTAKNKTVTEWKLKPERPDNHFWDCLVGCHVLASVQGASLTETSSPPKHLPPSQRPTLAQLKAGWRPS